MMARLPTIGGDGGNWGSVLNEFLEVAHNTDGTLKRTLKVFDVVEYGADSSNSGAENTAAIKLAVAALKTAGSGILLFPAALGTFDVSFDSTTTWMHKIFALPSHTTVLFEPGAKLRVVGAVPALFSGVFGSDITALPVSNLKFLNLHMQDTISGTDPALVRAITLNPHSPGFTHTPDEVSDILISGCTFIDFASPILFVSTNPQFDDPWDRIISNVRILNNYATGCVSAFATIDGRDVLVQGNQAYGKVSDPSVSYDGVSIHAGVNVRVVNNTFSHFTNPGGIIIHVQNSSIATNGVVNGTRDILIANNTILECYGASKAIGISDVPGEADYGTTNVTVAGNIIRGAGRGIVVSRVGDLGTPFNNITITGNVLEVHERGIDISAGGADRRIIGVTIGNNAIRVVPRGTVALTGTVSTAGTTLTGTGTQFTSELTVNDWILVAEHPARIVSVASDTSATITAYPGTTDAVNSSAQLLGSAVSAANSFGIRLLNVENVTMANNALLIVNGAGSYALYANSLRHTTITSNTLFAADDTLSGSDAPFLFSSIVQSVFVDNICRGLTTAETGSFTGTAHGNIFRTTGAEFNGHQIGGVPFGIESTPFWKQGTAAPISEAYLRGDKVINTTPEELGSPGSKYTISGWVCVAAGTPGTWVEQRSPTGN